MCEAAAAKSQTISKRRRPEPNTAVGSTLAGLRRGKQEESQPSGPETVPFCPPSLFDPHRHRRASSYQVGAASTVTNRPRQLPNQVIGMREEKFGATEFGIAAVYMPLQALGASSAGLV